MVSQVTVQYTYPHSFHKVASMLFLRYPNHLQPEVIHTDVVDTSMFEDGTLYVRRLLTLRRKLPHWTIPIIGRNVEAYALEDTFVNTRKSRIEIRTESLSFTRIFQAGSRSSYWTNGIPSNCVGFEINSWAQALIPGVQRLVESFITSNVEKNTHKGIKAFKDCIENGPERFRTDAAQQNAASGKATVP